MRVIARVAARLALALVVALATMAGKTRGLHTRTRRGYEYGFKIMNP